MSLNTSLSEELDERTLVADMLAGDQKAMEAFADHYFRPLYRFTLGRLHGDAELARDIVQTTVCKALGKLASYRGEAPLFAWLCSCCRNEIAMYFRQKKTRPQEVELDPGTPAPGGSITGTAAGTLAAARCANVQPSNPGASRPRLEEAPELALLAKERSHRVHLALDLLPAGYADALEWKYLDRLPVQEIAARLQRTPKATESLLTRARVAFRDQYQSLSRTVTPELGPRPHHPEGVHS